MVPSVHNVHYAILKTLVAKCIKSILTILESLISIILTLDLGLTRMS